MVPRLRETRSGGQMRPNFAAIEKGQYSTVMSKTAKSRYHFVPCLLLTVATRELPTNGPDPGGVAATSLVSQGVHQGCGKTERM